MTTLLLLAFVAHGAQSAPMPCSQAASVYAEILPQVDSISVERRGDDCAITYEPKAGVTVDFARRDALRRALLDELAAIEVKVDANTATLAELRRAVKIMLKLNGFARRP